jgi:hypothetical protein
MDILLRMPSPVQGSPAAFGSLLVELATGQVIQATVQRVAQDHVWLNLGGLILMARSEVPLQEQQRISLKVVEADQGQITLRLVSRSVGPGSAAGAGSAGQHAPVSLSASLEAMLTAWGLESDAVNLAIAEALLTYGQTVSPEDVLAVRSQWQALPSHQAGDVDALAYLRANRLPVSRESLELAQHWLNGSLPLAERLDALRQAMNAALAELRPMAGQQPALDQLIDTLTSATARLADWPINDQQSAAELAARLASLITELGTPPEAELTRRLPVLVQADRQAADASQEGKAAAQSTQGGAAVGDKCAAGLPESAAAPRASPTGASQQTLAEHPNLLRQVETALADALAHPRLDPAATHVLQRLEDQLSLVTRDLSAAQLANLSDVANPAAEPFYVFCIPMHTSQGARTAYLKVYHQPGHQSLDPDNLRLALLLDMPALGEIAVSLTAFEGHLSGQFLCARSDTHQDVAAGIDELRERLKSMGYRVDQLGSDLLPAPHKAELWAGTQASPPAAWVQVDLTV